MDSSKIISLEDYFRQQNRYPSEKEALEFALKLCDLLESTEEQYPLLSLKNIYIENDARWVVAHPPKIADPGEALYRAGSVLHSLLTRQPFHISHYLDGPPSVRIRNPQISVRMEAIIARLLQNVRSLRYSSIQEFKKDLERLQKEWKGEWQIRWSCFKQNGSRVNWIRDKSFQPEGKTLKELWHVPIGEIWASADVAGECLFIGSGNGHFYSIDSASGNVVWKMDTGGRIESTAAIHQDIAYVGNDLGYLFAIHIKNGSVLWKKLLGEYVRSSPFCDGELVYVGSINPTKKSGMLVAIESRNGFVHWKRSMGPVFSSPVVDRERILIGSDDETFYCFDRSGVEQWRRRLSGKIRSTAAVARDALYVGGFGGVFYKIRKRTGEIVWRNEEAGSMYSSAACGRNIVAVGNNSGILNLFYPTSGKKKKQFATGGPITASPLIVQDYILVGSNDGKFYILDLEGRVVTFFDARAPINSSAVYVEGIIYFGSDRGLHALSF